MNAQDLLAKAIQAAASAKILLDTGDADGTCKEDAAWAVSQAQTFVQAMQTTFMPKTPKKSSNGPAPF